MVPAYLRDQMRVDAEPAVDVHDDRVKAAFAMAPGDIQGFGMDDAGLWRMAIPAYLIVGAGDTATPPKENAEFAAKYIPHAQLDVLPGQVGHEIFDNECDQVGRDNYPHACIDALWCESGQAARVHRENRVEVLRCESERAETKAELKGMQNQVVSRERQDAGATKKMPDVDSDESSSGIAVDVQQRLNCALPSFSLSSGFFRSQSLKRHVRWMIN